MSLKEGRLPALVESRKEAMTQMETLTRTNLKTPKAAAIAGILFSVLLLVELWLLRISVPVDALEPGEWLGTRGATIATALGLTPFIGVAFLWFIGVLRDRLGSREDRFFATVFLGSGLLFLAMLFGAAAVAAAIITTFSARPGELAGSGTFTLGRALAFNIMNIYAAKMAGVFVFSTSTIAIYTGFAPRWIGYLGCLSALLLLFGSTHIDWAIFVLPLWVLLISSYILFDNLRGPLVAADRQ
jgi:hypothetical protein